MRALLVFKTPDVLAQLEGFTEEQNEEILRVCSKYLSYSENITVCVDTETETMEVIKYR
jgi:septum formation topological specificity factor MinE